MALPMLAQRIERWLIDRLVPFANNARVHSDSQVAEVAASIVEFGFVNPVLIGADGGIIAGHARVLAARKLGGYSCDRLAAVTPCFKDRREMTRIMLRIRSCPTGQWDRLAQGVSQ